VPSVGQEADSQKAMNLSVTPSHWTFRPPDSEDKFLLFISHPVHGGFDTTCPNGQRHIDIIYMSI
jgi:hypothetical protein